ncbi:ATP-binding protein [Cytophaga sp. FL35]|uniref:sensor histidine kinase n=1 Tax=Cytophaga sp. FL35 TaxID=1904456 RepID=UPI00165374FF|nr:ATP-binding protein [Cytophaga sp. FL35]MBC7000903.1 GAF domain-containing protein [Cytophaga sp. FL35]
MELTTTFQRDIEDVQSLSIVPTILDIVCRATGLQFAAIARVTDENWITCGVLDKIPFGLSVGDELEIGTTFCNQVRKTDKIVVIDHVKEDSVYRDHPIPLQYGFQSYISVPIVRKDGEFFGTLCALDIRPNRLNNAKIIDMFTLFSNLIAFHLDTIKTLKTQKHLIGQKEKQLDTYTYISSHDLQEPLRKIQLLTSSIQERESGNLSPRGMKYFDSIMKAATRMRRIVNDLLEYSQIGYRTDNFQHHDLEALIGRVRFRIQEEFGITHPFLQLGELCCLPIVPVQMEQLFYNIMHNSIRYRHKDRQPLVSIGCSIDKGTNFGLPSLEDDVEYCEIVITDNGIGFDPKFNLRIFEMFKRLHPDGENRSTGMGLTIAKRIAQNHDGDMIAIGKPGDCTMVKVYLPTGRSDGNA